MEMTLTAYTIEKLSDNIAEISELAKLHYKESCPYEDIPLNISWDKLLRMNDLGFLKVYVARKEGKLVGYAMFSINYSIEYNTSLQASMTNIFLHPDHRGFAGIKFITWCDKELKKLGVQVVYHHVKSKNDYGVLLKRLGYDIMNIVYSKRLD